MSYKDAAIAAEIRKSFPKHSKTAYSLAKRTNETGVMLCPRAKEIAALYLGQKKPENRRMKNRICGRLPDELAEKVKAKLNGGSMQDLLVMLLTEWVERKPYVPAQMEVLYPGDPGYDEAKGGGRMMNRRKCRSCYYHGLSGFAGVTCEYILITGKSRVLQMTPEERKGSCPFYEEIPRAKRTQRIVYSENGLWG